MNRTEREELIFRIADRAMRSTDPHEYVRAIGAIHVQLNDCGGMLVPQCYAGALEALVSEVSRTGEHPE